MLCCCFLQETPVEDDSEKTQNYKILVLKTMDEIENMLDVSSGEPFKIDPKLLNGGVKGDKEFFSSELVSISTVKEIADIDTENNDAQDEDLILIENDTQEAVNTENEDGQNTEISDELVPNDTDELISNETDKLVSNDTECNVKQRKNSKEKDDIQVEIVESDQEGDLSEEKESSENELKLEDRVDQKESETSRVVERVGHSKSKRVDNSGNMAEEKLVLVMSETDQSASENEFNPLESTLECQSAASSLLATGSPSIPISETDISKSDAFSSEGEITVVHLGKGRNVLTESETDDGQKIRHVDSITCEDDELSDVFDTESSPVKVKRKKRQSMVSESSANSLITEESELDKTEKYMDGLPYKSPSSPLKKFASHSTNSLEEVIKDTKFDKKTGVKSGKKADSPRKIYKRVVDEIKGLPDKGELEMSKNGLTEGDKSRTPEKMTTSCDSNIDTKGMTKSSEKKNSKKRTSEEIDVSEHSEHKKVLVSKTAIAEKFVVKALKKTPRKTARPKEIIEKACSENVEESELNISESCITEQNSRINDSKVNDKLKENDVSKDDECGFDDNVDGNHKTVQSPPVSDKKKKLSLKHRSPVNEANTEDVNKKKSPKRLTPNKMFEVLIDAKQEVQDACNTKDFSESKSEHKSASEENLDSCIEITSDDDTETEPVTKHDAHDDRLSLETNTIHELDSTELKNYSGSRAELETKKEEIASQGASNSSVKSNEADDTFTDGNASIIDLVSDTDNKADKVESDNNLKPKMSPLKGESESEKSTDATSLYTSPNKSPKKSPRQLSPRCSPKYSFRSPHIVEPSIDNPDTIIPSSQKKPSLSVKKIVTPKLKQKNAETESDSDIDPIPNLAEHLKSPHVPVIADEARSEKQDRTRLSSKELATLSENTQSSPTTTKRKSPVKQGGSLKKIAKTTNEQPDVYSEPEASSNKQTRIRKLSSKEPPTLSEKTQSSPTADKHNSPVNTIKEQRDVGAEPEQEVREPRRPRRSILKSVVKDKVDETDATQKPFQNLEEESSENKSTQKELRVKRKSISYTGLKKQEAEKSTPPRRRSERKTSASTSKKSPKKTEIARKSLRKRRLSDQFLDSETGSTTDDPEISFPKIKKVFTIGSVKQKNFRVNCDYFLIFSYTSV